MARSQSEFQTAIGLGFLCLTTLSFQALMHQTRAEPPFPSSLLTTKTPSDPLDESAPNAASLQAIQPIIAQLFSLVNELNSTLSTLCPDCALVSGDQRAHIQSTVEEVDAMGLAFGGAFVMLAWCAGLVIFLTSLADSRSPGFMEKVAACGLVGANVSVAYSFFWADSMLWHDYVVYALWPAYAAMVGGVLLG